MFCATTINVVDVYLVALISWSYVKFVCHYADGFLFSNFVLHLWMSDQASLETEARISSVLYEKKKLFNNLLTSKGDCYM